MCPSIKLLPRNLRPWDEAKDSRTMKGSGLPLARCTKPCFFSPLQAVSRLFFFPQLIQLQCVNSLFPLSILYSLTMLPVTHLVLHCSCFSIFKERACHCLTQQQIPHYTQLPNQQSDNVFIKPLLKAYYNVSYGNCILLQHWHFFKFITLFLTLLWQRILVLAWPWNCAKGCGLLHNFTFIKLWVPA